ncbi:MAG: hypothetical protein DIZ80_15635 [endosymbiont of Galathealinum brachiosum]|uniref:Uncharacterized protein n=1 Tax=endosymbiont of Galathealinum brachiosum TaxID=2200906 RepID=A0A370DA99_9GAMM|nr:MAG: hypothetical protein DIZ80_15635 [endosymbiont of Galathealinum brachiosum]
MDNKKFNVTILQTQTSESLAGQLAKLFKISPEKALQILQKESFIIKKQTDKTTAEKFHKAISSVGVNCRIDEIITEEESALPEIEEVKTSAQAKPLTDITRPEITPLHSEHASLSLADGPADKNTPDTQDVIKDIDPANFCPDCGTIRASANSACLHCGYDPEELKRNKTKATLIKAGIIFIIFIICAAIAYPFYQQYARQKKIEKDLMLAYDTRNAVTEFILKTNFWPNQNIDAGLDKQISNQTLKSVTVGESSTITVVLRAQALDGEEQTLIFTPHTLKGRIVWNCLKGTLKNEFRPELCRTQTE